VFAALGAFVQSFHSDTTVWVHEHAWIVWATAPVAAVLAYELHLGWVHRKQLIRHGYVHPSAKSGYGRHVQGVPRWPSCTKGLHHGGQPCTVPVGGRRPARAHACSPAQAAEA
jgi:hypothetical protein